MSWGNKLLIAFILFAGLIGTLVYKAVNTHFDLVSNNYYQDELKYEDRITALQNTAALSRLNVNENPTDIYVSLPTEMNGKSLKGQLLFYCKTNADFDRSFALAENSATTVVAKNKLSKGPYLLKISWNSGGKNFYAEKDLIIQ